MDGLGGKIRRLRIERGMTQKELGELLGVRNSIVSFYEGGDRLPSLDLIVRIAQIFNVTSDYLLGISSDRGGISTDGLNEDQMAALSKVAELMKKDKN